MVRANLKFFIFAAFTSIFFLQEANLDAFTLISNAGKPAYWPSGHISYRFNTATSGYFTGGHDASGTVTDEFAPIRAGFQSWLDVPGLNISITENAASSAAPSSDDGRNTIIWIKNAWTNLSFQPPNNALAVTLLSFDGSGAIVDADIYFNAEAFHWAVVDSGTELGYIDVQNIATHEIGHLLGLDHSSEDLFEDDPVLADATMFYAASYGETERRDLKIDDTRAIQNLYGASRGAPPTITALSVLETTSRSITYKITGTNFDEYTAFVLTKNNPAISDAVSRYKTIVSPTEAHAEFDTSRLADGPGSMVAFNSPSQLATFGVQLTGTGLGATSVGASSGGCVLSSETSSPSIFLLFILMSISLFILRKKNN
jgi:hypothetical protein